MTEEPLHLETPRLIVRRFTDDDIPDILAYSRFSAADAERRRNIGWAPTEDSVRSWWTPMKTMSVEEATDWLSLVIEVRSVGRLVGQVGFRTEAIGEHRQAMTGWILGKEHEGRGYATEAETALLDHLFAVEGFHRVYAKTSPANVRSWRLMERLGMRREAHFIRNCFHDGVWVDEFLYAVLAEEWMTRGQQREADRHGGGTGDTSTA